MMNVRIEILCGVRAVLVMYLDYVRRWGLEGMTEPAYFRRDRGGGLMLGCLV